MCSLNREYKHANGANGSFEGGVKGFLSKWSPFGGTNKQPAVVEQIEIMEQQDTSRSDYADDA